MHEYITAVKEENRSKEEEDKGEVFTLDKVEMRYFKPSPGQLALLIAQTGNFSSEDEQISSVINFFLKVLDKRSSSHLVSRLMDRDDNFELEQVIDIMEDMIEEWTGRPIMRRSDSTESRSAAGPESTDTTPVSTSSDSQVTSS